MPGTPSILFLIDADPRVSARPAEAVRIAAGIAAWNQGKVSLCLVGPAAAALTDWPEDLKDGDSFERCLPSFIESGGRIYTLAKTVEPAAPRGPAVGFEKIAAPELADLSARATQLLRF